MQTDQLSTKKVRECDETFEDLQKFERKQYGLRLIGLDDFTKKELVEMIEENGWEMPGKTFYDEESGSIVREDCPKRDYLEVCKANFVQPESHIVRRAAIVSGRESTVTLFRARRDGCRCRVYDLRGCESFEIVLSKFRLQELNLPQTPEVDADWDSWSRFLIERLFISEDRTLSIGPPKIQKNGLPKNFAFVDEESLGEMTRQKQAGIHNNQLANAGRLNIRMFFDIP